MVRAGRPVHRCPALRHGVGRLCRRPVHPAVTPAAAPARTHLVPAHAPHLLRGGQFARRRRREPGRRRLLPLHAEALYGRRDLLRRQRQLAAARRQVHGRELAARRGVAAADPSAGRRLRAESPRREPAAPRLALLCRRHGDPGPGRRAQHCRRPRGHDPHDPADHPLERHALHGRQRQGEPHPEQPLLHPAHHRGRRQQPLPQVLLRRGAAPPLHADPPTGRLGRQP